MLSKHLPQLTLKSNFGNSSKVDTLSSNVFYSIDKIDNIIIRSEQHSEAYGNQNKYQFLFMLSSRAAGDSEKFQLIRFVKKPLKPSVEDLNFFDDQMWLDIHSQDIYNYKLNESDYIKYGKFIFRISKTFSENGKIYTKNNHVGNSIFPQIFEINMEEKNMDEKNMDEKKCKKQMCQICREGVDSFGRGPVVSFCNCKNFFHLNCFRESFVEKRNGGGSILINSFGCDKCEMWYPLQFKLKTKDGNDEIFNLLDDEKNILFLESLNYKVNYKEGDDFKKLIYILSKDQNTVGDIIECLKKDFPNVEGVFIFKESIIIDKNKVAIKIGKVNIVAVLDNGNIEDEDLNQSDFNTREVENEQKDPKEENSYWNVWRNIIQSNQLLY